MIATSRARYFLVVVAGTFALQLMGCATYQNKIKDARDLIGTNQSEKAIAILEPLANKDNDDQLAYMLDYGMALHQSGKYKQSASVLSQAEKIADIQDYTSISKQTASLLLSEGMVQYKGDDFEKVLINAMNAINYVMLNDLDGALVEVRRLNNKLVLYKNEAKKNYEQNPFAFYLSAIIWEADRKYDDAYIAYKHAYELAPAFKPLREDLIRSAIRADRPDELTKWKKAFPEVKVRPEWKDKTMGELVFIYQQGWGPRKGARPEAPRFPKLFPVPTVTNQARLEVWPQTAVQVILQEAPTETIYSVTDVAIKTLDDDYAALIAKRVAGVAAKAVVADQIRQKNELLGAAAWIAMNIADQADLRQWSTLPGTLQIARIYLKPGKYNVSATGMNSAGAATGEAMAPKEIEIKAGQKSFTTWRSFR